MTEVDRKDIDLDEHTDIAENIDEATLQSIKQWSLVDMSVAMKKAQSVLFSRADQTLSGRNIESDYTMNDEEKHYVSSYCSGKLCWSLEPRSRVKTADLEDPNIPSVFFCSAIGSCATHEDQRKVLGVLRSNIGDQTVHQSIRSELRVNSLGPQGRSAIWHSDLTQARHFLEEHVFANITLILEREYGPEPDVHYRLCLMNPAREELDLLHHQSSNCDGSDCSSQDTANQYRAAARLSQLQLNKAGDSSGADLMFDI